MVLIHGTNILVDDFDHKRPNRSSYIYFLTHFHYDYYKGINKKWSDEKIYCSDVTRKLLLQKFPNLTNVEALEIDETYQNIFLDKQKSIYIDVTFFDANHCIGSVMILFKGYMGTILHTGDFRYSKKMPSQLAALYPENQRNSKNEGISIHIDELILDATYADPMFVFPRRNDAFNELVRIIEENSGKQFCIVTSKFGKEELLVHVASRYDIKILVDKTKFDIINTSEYYQDTFTDDPEEAGFIQAIHRSEIPQKLSEGYIVFVPTGLCNKLRVEIEPNYYGIGYSLHSNYDELGQFLKSIKPAKLTVSPKTQQNKLPHEKLVKSKLNQFQKLRATKANGIPALALKYCDQKKLSEDYRNLLDLHVLATVQKELGLTKSSASGNKKNTKKHASKNNGRATNNNKGSQRGEYMIDAVEIEDSGYFEELQDDDDEEDYEEEIETSQRRNVINVDEEEHEDESWKAMYKNDRQKFGQKSQVQLNEEERKILRVLEQQPEDYIPFSDTSDKEDYANEDSGEFEQEEPEMEIMSHKSSEIEEEEEESMNGQMPEYPLLKNKPEPLKLYSGVLTLTVTMKDKASTSGIREEFSLYTNQKPTRKFRFPKDMKFQNTKPFSEVASLIKEVLQPKDYNLEYKRSSVTGWVETEKDDLIFRKLAEHMERKGIVRYYEIDSRSTIYFLAPSQVNKVINNEAPMIFVLSMIRD